MATLRHLRASQHHEQQHAATPGANTPTTTPENQQQQQQRGSIVDSNSSHKPLLFLTDLQAGHFAASGASSRLEKRAMKVAFLLSVLEQGC